MKKRWTFWGECLIPFYGFPHEYVKLQKAVHMHISISHPFQSKLAQQINNQQSLAEKRRQQKAIRWDERRCEAVAVKKLQQEVQGKNQKPGKKHQIVITRDALDRMKRF